MIRLGCLDEGKNVFFVREGDASLIVKQPDSADYGDIKEALKLASERTYLRYPSPVWEHPEGTCHLSRFERGALGAVYFIIKVSEKIVGFCHHVYWNLNKEAREWGSFPIPIGSRTALIQSCILDPYQGRAIEGLCVKVNEYIAKRNGACFVMSEAFQGEKILDAFFEEGWNEYDEYAAYDGSARVLVGKPLTANSEIRIRAKNDVV